MNEEFDVLVSKYMDKEMKLPDEHRLFEMMNEHPELEEELKGQVAIHNLLCIYFADEKGTRRPDLTPLPIWMDDFDPENPPLPEFPPEPELESDWYSVLVDANASSPMLN